MFLFLLILCGLAVASVYVILHGAWRFFTYRDIEWSPDDDESYRLECRRQAT